MLKDEFVEKLNSLSKESLIKYLSSTNFYKEFNRLNLKFNKLCKKFDNLEKEYKSINE